MSLSDKIENGNDCCSVCKKRHLKFSFIRESYVKEFIKELKEKAEEYEWEGSEIIDELAGEGLV